MGCCTGNSLRFSHHCRCLTNHLPDKFATQGTYERNESNLKLFVQDKTRGRGELQRAGDFSNLIASNKEAGASPETCFPPPSFPPLHAPQRTLYHRTHFGLQPTTKRRSLTSLENCIEAGRGRVFMQGRLAIFERVFFRILREREVCNRSAGE